MIHRSLTTGWKRAGCVVLVVLVALMCVQPMPSGSRASAAPQATPVPTPTPVGSAAVPQEPPAQAAPAVPANGTIIAMDQIPVPAESRYYAITYWSDGLRIRGFLGIPAGEGSFPAVILNRGGGGWTGTLGGGEIVPYVECGFVTVASQYRGSGGSEGYEEYGGRDLIDVLSLIPLLRSLPEVDPGRIGMVGGSRGGMMTFLALKHDTQVGANNIRVAVTIGGISDLIAWSEQRPEVVSALYLPYIGTSPAQNREPFITRSAVYWPEMINAPLLLLHGEADQDVSIQQTLTLADKLRALGKTVQVITYPGGEHSLYNVGGGYSDSIAWLAQYIGTPGYDYSFAKYEPMVHALAAWFVKYYRP